MKLTLFVYIVERVGLYIFMSKKEESRQLIKSKCEELWLAGKHKGINLCLEFSTGVGKTLNAINLQNIMTNELSRRTYVCVAEIAHIQNWKDEYVKHGYEHLLSNTDIFCYASLKKYINRNNCDLLILDRILSN